MSKKISDIIIKNFGESMNPQPLVPPIRKHNSPVRSANTQKPRSNRQSSNRRQGR